MRMKAWALAAGLCSFAASAASGQGVEPPADESVLGELPITGTQTEHVTSLAVLPSLAPDLEDVIVRGVVRRDLELTGMFRVLADKKAPAGLYNFDDPVDVDAWRKAGAEVIVKAAARKRRAGRVEVLGLAYFLNVGKDPVYEKKLLVRKDEVRVTAHRITDALLGALTGRNGGFASRLTFSGRWGSEMRVFTMDADGHGLTARSAENVTAIAPTFGPGAGGAFSDLYFLRSEHYAPFELVHEQATVPLAVPGSVYSVDFSHDGKRMAIAVGGSTGTVIYTANPDGSDTKTASATRIATHAVFSPSGKLAWVGGGTARGSPRRIYVDGKAVSPPGFSASAPTFCDTEDGLRLVFSVAVGGDRRDLVMTDERGHGIVRLTQNQGSNTYPACSPDGRLLAFFSTRKKQKGIYFMNLKRWKTQKLSGRYGQGLRWAPLPPPKSAAPREPEVSFLREPPPDVGPARPSRLRSPWPRSPDTPAPRERSSGPPPPPG